MPLTGVSLFCLKPRSWRAGWAACPRWASTSGRCSREGLGVQDLGITGPVLLTGVGVRVLHSQPRSWRAGWAACRRWGSTSCPCSTCWR